MFKTLTRSRDHAKPRDGRFTGQLISSRLRFFRGNQREYSSKPPKHSIVKRILVFKR